MFKKLFQITGLFALILCSAMIVHASGKMEVPIGQQVLLTADEIGANLTYKWVIKKEDRILATLTQRELRYTFNEPGEYAVTASVTDQANRAKTTKILVLSGDTYARAAASGAENAEEESVYGPAGLQGSSGGAGNLGAKESLRLALETLPHKGPDGRIHLIGNEGKVTFDLQKSKGEILEYRIDQDIYKDKDGNGTANDDIDNAGDTSYLTGRPWEAAYKNEGAPHIVAEITLVDKEGKKAKQQMEIVFDPLPDRTGEPVAVLEVSPAPDPVTRKVMLAGSEAEVSFYARPSTGNILEYRIDKDIFADSDNDGNAGNDIDNLNDPSFKTGDVWRTVYKKTDAQIIAQLIVVGPGGKGSRVQRALTFGSAPASSKPSDIHIEANKSFVRAGDPVEFQVVGLQQAMQSYTFNWDFESDGAVDKEVEGESVIEHIFDEPGVYAVKVKIQDQEGNSGERQIEMTVKEKSKTIADFAYTVDNGKVVFENKSAASETLADRRLSYQWNFGDVNEENFVRQRAQQEETNPAYEYVESGKIKVILRVTDASGAVSESAQEIEVTEDMAKAVRKGEEVETQHVVSPAEQEPAAGQGAGLFTKILKIVLYAVLAIAALILLFIVGFIAVIKLQHPDLSFDEVIEEFKWKVLMMLGIHEHEVEAVTAESHDNAGEVVEAQHVAPPSQPEPEKTDEAVEGEVVDENVETRDLASPDKPTTESAPPPAGQPKQPEAGAPPSDATGPIPDWLKNV